MGVFLAPGVLTKATFFRPPLQLTLHEVAAISLCACSVAVDKQYLLDRFANCYVSSDHRPTPSSRLYPLQRRSVVVHRSLGVSMQ